MLHLFHHAVKRCDRNVMDGKQPVVIAGDTYMLADRAVVSLMEERMVRWRCRAQPKKTCKGKSKSPLAPFFKKGDPILHLFHHAVKRCARNVMDGKRPRVIASKHVRRFQFLPL